MAVIIFTILWTSVAVASAATPGDGILEIDYPNIAIHAEKNGSVTAKSGTGGDLYISPGPNGTVFFEGHNMMHLIQIIESLPPVWVQPSSVGFYGTFHGGELVNVRLEARDPRGQKVNYTVVAGDVPPGMHIDSPNSLMTGITPDVDAVYSFTIRATTEYQKSADAIFTMEIIAEDQCMPMPCKNGGTCYYTYGSVHFTCNCTANYGGHTCETVCGNNPLGVSNRSIITDAQMTGYQYRSGYPAHRGRQSVADMGWCGIGSSSWLQVDLGNISRVFRVSSQSYSSTYYTSGYYVSYSTDGNSFTDVKQTSGSSTKLAVSGATSNTIMYKTLPYMIRARYIRFHPYGFDSRYYPCMRVEVFGCTP